MAAPVDDLYQAPSGGTIRAGWRYVAPTVALMGDSLTADSYGLSPWHVANAICGSKLNVLTNAGVANKDVVEMLGRIDNAYDAASPGWAGLPEIGIGYVMAGTNNARGSASIATLAPSYTALLNKIAGYTKKVIVMSVPPLADSAQNALTIAYNAWLSDFCAAAPDKFKWVDAGALLRNSDGSQITAYFSDGVHFNQAARAVLAEPLADVLPTVIALDDLPSPISTDAADVYPAAPQWVGNHLMAGASGSAGGGLTGAVATGYAISSSGSGIAGALEKVAADVSDVNQTAWQRIKLTSGVAASKVRITTALQGRVISATDPASLEYVAELRFNGIDRTLIDYVQIYAQGSPGSEYLMQRNNHPLQATGVENRRHVYRFRRARGGATTPTTVVLYVDIVVRATFGPGASIGSIDFRNLTVRG